MGSQMRERMQRKPAMRVQRPESRKLYDMLSFFHKQTKAYIGLRKDEGKRAFTLRLINYPDQNIH